MSSVVTCPFGCASTRNELLMFKQISINYFDQIMVKFNNQDRMINDLVVKLDQCLNFNYQYGEHSVPYEASSTSQPEDSVGVAPVQNNDTNEEIICFITDDQMEPKYSDFRESLEEVRCQSSPQRSHREAATNSMHDETIAPGYWNNEFITDRSPPHTTASQPPKSNQQKSKSSATWSSLRSLNDTTTPTFRRGGTRQKRDCGGVVGFRPNIDGMTTMEIRNKYSTGGDNEPVKCKLCQKEFSWNACYPAVRTSNFAKHIKCVHHATGKTVTVYGLMKKPPGKKQKKNTQQKNRKVDGGQCNVGRMPASRSGNKRSPALDVDYAAYQNKPHDNNFGAAIELVQDETIIPSLQHYTNEFAVEPQLQTTSMHSKSDLTDATTTLSTTSVKSLNDATEPAFRRGGTRQTRDGTRQTRDGTRQKRDCGGVVGFRPNIDGMTSLEIRNIYSTGGDNEPIKCKLCHKEFPCNDGYPAVVRTSNFAKHIKCVHHATGKSITVYSLSRKLKKEQEKGQTIDEGFDLDRSSVEGIAAGQVRMENTSAMMEHDDSGSNDSCCKAAHPASEFISGTELMEDDAIIPAVQESNMITTEPKAATAADFIDDNITASTSSSSTSPDVSSDSTEPPVCSPTVI